MAIADLRQEYEQPPLREADMAADPIEQFRRWFEMARAANILEPNAMTLATCEADGSPSARIVLLKEVDAEGFIFYTSYLSDKAAAMKDNPRVELVFWWDVLQRSVRIAGEVTRVSRQEAEDYFRTRPRLSQVGAWASQQSSVIANREALHDAFAQVEKQHAGKDIPLPPFWGGYRVRPQRVEFWEGQRSRLHDRLRYVRERDGAWKLERLSP